MSKDLPPSRTADQFVVRFPDGMRERIAESAKLSGRSMNAEIVARLQSSFSGGADNDLIVSQARELFSLKAIAAASVPLLSALKWAIENGERPSAELLASVEVTMQQGAPHSQFFVNLTAEEVAKLADLIEDDPAAATRRMRSNG